MKNEDNDNIIINKKIIFQVNKRICSPTKISFPSTQINFILNDLICMKNKTYCNHDSLNHFCQARKFRPIVQLKK